MAVVWKKLAYEDDVITKALLTTKGDIIYASAPGVPAALPIGTDTQLLNVATDVPGWVNIPAPAAHKLNSHTAPDGAVDFNYQQASYLVVQTVANEAALPATTGTSEVGQLCWATGELTLHICTEST